MKNYIAAVKDYPKEGIIFRDITPLLADGKAFAHSVNEMTKFAIERNVDVIVGPEARGFIFGCPVAKDLGIGFIPVRKPNKLPRETVKCSYDLEYGTNELHIHKDGIKAGQRVLIVDDLLATGGTIEATINLVEGLGATVVGCAFLIELEELNGRDLLSGNEILSLIKY